MTKPWYPAKKKGEDDEPKSAVRQAMRLQAQENRQYLKEIAFLIPYAKYRSQAKLQEFESALYLVLSDRFEEVPEAERLEVCRGKELEPIRESPLYADLKAEVEKVATQIDEQKDLSAADWVKQEGSTVRRRIAREVKFGKKPLVAVRAAESLLDREMPKTSRNQGGAIGVIITEKHAELIGKALGIINTDERHVLTPAIDITPKTK